MLWLGGALKHKNLIIPKIATQTDLITTLLLQLDLQNNRLPFSRNILSSDTLQFGFFQFNDGFGMVQPKSHLLFDNIGKQLIFREGEVKNSDIQAGKALQQVIYDDFTKR